MPALSFQNQFAPLVESGEKRQTIRAFRKDGRDPKVGDTLYLCTGMRTKQCRKLGEAVCIEASNVKMNRGIFVISFTPEGMRGPLAADDVAVADGFADYNDMLDWFEKVHGLPFEGLLIRWGDLTDGD